MQPPFYPNFPSAFPSLFPHGLRYLRGTDFPNTWYLRFPSNVQPSLLIFNSYRIHGFPPLLLSSFNIQFHFSANLQFVCKGKHLFSIHQSVESFPIFLLSLSAGLIYQQTQSLFAKTNSTLLSIPWVSLPTLQVQYAPEWAIIFLAPVMKAGEKVRLGSVCIASQSMTILVCKKEKSLCIMAKFLSCCY